MWTPLLLSLVSEVVAPLVVLEVLQPLVLSPLIRSFSIISVSSVMLLIIACLLVVFGFASIVANKVLDIICPTVLRFLPAEILVLSSLLLLQRLPVLLPPLLR
ncbi:hypothetical protein Acr_01g0005800 [Actinidia rufa]|uniref:Uncharacterized protein n=1 Tax=Actinidia rufa TaxID=165716 RepID=A0A7J0E2Q1_9ERIC|nr:hypothetical protein Acr_01g0005800 [Actinidia rufa]